MTYHVDRLYAAVSVLAGDGHIKQRLMKAYQEYLDDIAAHELPKSMQGTFASLKSRMSEVAPLNGEGRICATVRKMSVHEASDCAASVVSLYGDILRQADYASDPIPLNETHENVPAFLVKSAS
jgi:hypothetical protein